MTTGTFKTAARVWAVAVLALVSAFATAARAQSSGKMNQDPDAAKLVTSDLGNFLHAYALASAAGTTDEKAAIYQREYLDKGSPGLKDFLASRIRSAQNLARRTELRPKYYASLKDIIPQVAEMEPAIRGSFRKLKSLYSDAVFPDVYFLIGIMNSGGTTSDSGLLIGLEMHGKTDATDMSEMDSWLKAVLGPPSDLPGIVAHELIHYQQGSHGETLLAQAFREGSADFVGQLISGQSINQNIYAYGNAHEGELWKEFSASMNGTDISHWLYQGDQSKDRPADLGYYIGYRIAQSYYDRAADKTQALRDILTVSDYPALLRESHYADKFTQAAAQE